ncbi:MAG TPA: universal stress protein [Candidatus Acidoferrum sp.]|nr:universal stress protein [Candidatus Acidoferrum sp.]
MSSSSLATEIGIHRILAAIDFSPSSIKALNHAIEIARSYGATFYLAHVVSSIGYVMAGADAMAAAVDTAAQELRELEQRLSRTGTLAGLPHEMLVCQGDVWHQLAQIVREQGIDLIVLGTQGKTGLRKLALGSVAESVFQHALCPVLTVGPCAPADPPLHGELSHILYPTDLSPESAKAAAYAVSLAREHGAELTLVHVHEKGEAGHIAEDASEFAERFRRHFAGELPHKWWYEQQVGLVDQTILGLARERHIGLIVLGLHSRRPFIHPHSWLHAYKIVSEACCPVLTIRGG